MSCISTAAARQDIQVHNVQMILCDTALCRSKNEMIYQHINWELRKHVQVKY
jgi:hypothetical protein